MTSHLERLEHIKIDVQSTLSGGAEQLQTSTKAECGCLRVHLCGSPTPTKIANGADACRSVLEMRRHGRRIATAGGAARRPSGVFGALGALAFDVCNRPTVSTFRCARAVLRGGHLARSARFLARGTQTHTVMIQLNANGSSALDACSGIRGLCFSGFFALGWFALGSCALGWFACMTYELI